MRNSRRVTIAVAVVALTAALTSSIPEASGGTEAFPFGVAARAEATQAMLWTRAAGSGVYYYQVALDPTFLSVVGNDSLAALEDNDFTLTATVPDLNPSTIYYYRFLSEQGVASDTGTFLTLPDPNVDADMELALASDSDILWHDHPEPVTADFEVLARVLEDRPDLFVYLGDTIYSDSETGAPPALTIQDKWAKYQANRTDTTQTTLAGVSTWAVWDDHEVINDFEGAQLAIDDPALLQAGRDAFNDYWPVDQTTYYRKIDYGKKVDLIFLDERTYRTQNAAHSGGPCVDDKGRADLAPTMPEDERAFLGLGPADPACIADVFDPDRTMLGLKQLRWFKRQLVNSTAKWKLVVNEVPITQLYALPYDRWEGYHAERNQILSFIARSKIKNVVFLTTDLHLHAGARVYTDITRTGARPAAYEMIAGPIQARTFNQEVEGVLGIENGGTIFKNFLVEHGLVDLDCANTEKYGYGLVSTLGPTAEELRLQWKSHKQGARGGRRVAGCSAVVLPDAFAPN